MAPWALAVLGAPEVHSVQEGLVALVGLGCQPGPVHPEVGGNKCQRERALGCGTVPPQCHAPGEALPWALGEAAVAWRDGAVVVTHAEAGGGEEVAKTLGLQRRGFQRGFAA